MRVRDLSAGTRFFAALGVLLAALAVMVGVGLSGLTAVDSANRHVFADNFLTAEATSRVATDLASVEVLSLEIVRTANPSAVERLRARLNEIAIPRTGVSIAALVTAHRNDPPAERAGINRISAAWQAFLPVTRRPPFSSGLGAISASAASTAGQTVSGRLDPLIASVAARQSTETAAVGGANASVHHVFEKSRGWMVGAAAFGLLAAITMFRIGVMLRQLLRDQAEAHEHSQSTSEYTETLQGTANEDEAQELLRRQIQRTQPGTRAVVLGRNNSADRLEARTSLTELGELRPLCSSTLPRPPVWPSDLPVATPTAAHEPS